METTQPKEQLTLPSDFEGIVKARVKFNKKRYELDENNNVICVGEDEIFVDDGVLVFNRENPEERFLMHDYSGEEDAMVWVPAENVEVHEIAYKYSDGSVGSGAGINPWHTPVTEINGSSRPYKNLIEKEEE